MARQMMKEWEDKKKGVEDKQKEMEDKKKEFEKFGDKLNRLHPEVRKAFEELHKSRALSSTPVQAFRMEGSENLKSSLAYSSSAGVNVTGVSVLPQKIVGRASTFDDISTLSSASAGNGDNSVSSSRCNKTTTVISGTAGDEVQCHKVDNADLEVFSCMLSLMKPIKCVALSNSIIQAVEGSDKAGLVNNAIFHINKEVQTDVFEHKEVRKKSLDILESYEEVDDKFTFLEIVFEKFLNQFVSESESSDNTFQDTSTSCTTKPSSGE